MAIGIENGLPIGNDLALLETYHDLGAAYVGLTHSALISAESEARPE